MKIKFENKIYTILEQKLGRSVSKNDFIRWIQQIGRGAVLTDVQTSAEIYGNYNVWEVGVLEATKSLVKKYKKKGIEIKKEIHNGKKVVVIEFPDEHKEEILEQILPKHITFEEMKARLIKTTRDFIRRTASEKLLKENYDIAYKWYEKNKDSDDPIKNRFTYWYYFKIGISVENETAN